ncbi:MAG: glycosyl transferase family 2 [Gammaproteobacteria bacterium]|jgi:glycosyltransferase involved in cell wall biosynthesis|nr:glycosyl transferase family 2 [Gammaproteobacteria bacterium]
MAVKITLAILNRNDLAGSRSIIPRINRSLFHEIFVVDGDSTDGSKDYFVSQKLTTYIVASGGRGAAMRFATSKATGTHLVFLSSDGEENPDDLQNFITYFEQGADLVIASRLAKGGYHKGQAHWYYIHRLFYLKFITFLINRMFGAKLTDCWNGYRGFRLEALRSTPTDAEDFMLEAQQTIRFLKRGYCIIEFPTQEGVRVEGGSSNPIIKSGWLHLVMIFQERFLID